MGKIKEFHRFLDEAGDTAFYGKGRINIVGRQGVSNTFILGMVKFREPLDEVRRKIVELQNVIANDPFYKDIPSIEKKKNDKGFFFHATDDIPEVRERFFKFIKNLDCSFEAIVARKIPEIFEKKHHSNDAEFYADLLSHLLKNKFGKERKLVLNIAKRQNSTNNHNLNIALQKAISRFSAKYPSKDIKTTVVFNVQNQLAEPLLNISNYSCWTVQRIFERGEVRYYNFLIDKVSLVIDLYDKNNWIGNKHYYNAKNSLTPQNKISPPIT